MRADWRSVLDSLRDPRVRWSVLVRDDAGADVFAHDPGDLLPCASVGKLPLLIDVARAFSSGDLAPEEPLHRTDADRVADSGVWQHLTPDALPARDLARLVGMASDNGATNTLLRRLGGAAAVTERVAAIGVTDVVLLDRVRDVRGPEHPPMLAAASAQGCVDLWQRLAAGTIHSPEDSAEVLALLADGLDLSMVAGAFGLDPLAHAAPDRGFSVVHKTGTDSGVRADTGILTGPTGRLTYACLAAWTPSDGDGERDDVLRAMHRLGRALRTSVS